MINEQEYLEICKLLEDPNNTLHEYINNLKYGQELYPYGEATCKKCKNYSIPIEEITGSYYKSQCEFWLGKDGKILDYFKCLKCGHEETIEELSLSNIYLKKQLEINKEIQELFKKETK